MSAFLYGIGLQWKLDFRSKGILLTYYIIPLIFFLFMGGIFTSIDPNAYKTLIQSMTVFGVTMGAIIGTPTSLVEFYNSDIRKAYRVGGVPLWTGAVNNFISGLIHLSIMSIILFFIAQIVFDASVPSNLFRYFVTLELFIITSLSVGVILGLFVKSTSKLTMVSQLVFLPSVMLSGIMFPIDMLPNFMQMIGKVFPATWGYLNLSANQWEMMSMFPFMLTILIALLLCTWRLGRLHTTE
ncbi:ABC transporter [Lysinibacillus contaminans]|uniref:ABC transporter n=1 Tax=Lysinibacillus contaminans TaxID=1293441 RepID=A0ABR5JZU4_9BACI|nr:ABC transporter permease [Lysinibacillus contaminans]KOS68180.1 ABC transporter [Lysinibacillus contaminans]